MPQIQASGSPTNLSVSNLRVTTPTITNTTMAAANTEQAIALPANTARFRICVRNNAVLKLAFTATESGTNYITIWPGAYYIENQIDRVSTTLYIQSSKAGEVVEIVSWV